MGDYIYPGVLSCIALLIYYFTLLKSGTARQKYKISAPLHEGPEEYVRIVRAHQNTLEHLVIFLPGLWLFAFSVDPIWASIIGIFWPIGRLMYAFGYYQKAENRVLGLYVSMPPIYIFILGSFISFFMELF
jgi:glutathione S-transferase|tara:strand:- start:222 stop:614 length:393 start_codon:yes stop_codon:yes gene_type:complete